MINNALEKLGGKLKNSYHQVKMKTNFQNLWDTKKIVLKGRFMTVSAYIKKSEKFQINNLIMHLNISEKWE
jgi:hypothetical protein